MAAPTTRDDHTDGHTDELLTIDQLAERTGVSVRTIRFYSGKGLIPAPHLRGRTGLYDVRHQARLDLIGELSALGFTLAAIERRLERVSHDAGPEELALQLALLTPWAPEDVPGTDDEPRLELDGLPPDLTRRAQEIIERHTTALADDLMTLFQDEVLQPYRERGRPAEERTRLAAALSRLKPVTVQGVVTAFGHAVNRSIRERAGAERHYAASMAAFEFPVRVRYHEVDAQGVVFNAWYLAWFDEALTGFLEHRQLSYTSMLDAGYDVQLVHTEIDWKAGVGWVDDVVVAVATARLGTTSFDLDFEVRLEGRTTCSARTTYVVIAADGSGKREIPTLIRNALGEPSPLRS